MFIFAIYLDWDELQQILLDLLVNTHHTDLDKLKQTLEDEADYIDAHPEAADAIKFLAAETGKGALDRKPTAGLESAHIDVVSSCAGHSGLFTIVCSDCKSEYQHWNKPLVGAARPINVRGKGKDGLYQVRITSSMGDYKSCRPHFKTVQHAKEFAENILNGKSTSRRTPKDWSSFRFSIRPANVDPKLYVRVNTTCGQCMLSKHGLNESLSKKLTEAAYTTLTRSKIESLLDELLKPGTSTPFIPFIGRYISAYKSLLKLVDKGDAGMTRWRTLAKSLVCDDMSSCINATLLAVFADKELLVDGIISIMYSIYDDQTMQDFSELIDKYSDQLALTYADYIQDRYEHFTRDDLELKLLELAYYKSLGQNVDLTIDISDSSKKCFIIKQAPKEGKAKPVYLKLRKPLSDANALCALTLQPAEDWVLTKDSDDIIDRFVLFTDVIEARQFARKLAKDTNIPTIVMNPASWDLTEPVSSLHDPDKFVLENTKCGKCYSGRPRNDLYETPGATAPDAYF